MDREKLQNISEEMKDFLSSSLHFWLERCVDQGKGYLVCFDENGNPTQSLEVLEPTDKMIVTQTRMLWGFSVMMNTGFAKELNLEVECSQAAMQGFQFFIEKFWDKDFGGFVWYTNREGEVQDAGKLVYGQSFAIYALAEYYRMSFDFRALEYAEKTFDCLMKYCVDTARGGYYENLTRDWTPETERDSGGDLKSLDIHMHLMEAFTVLYEVSGNKLHKRRLEEVIEIIEKHMVDYKYGCGGNQYDNYFRAKPAWCIKRTWNYDRDPEHANQNPLDTTSYGHNIELTWLLNRAYKVLRQKPAAAFTKLLADYTIAHGWDYRNKGLYRDGMHDGRVVVTDKEWWQNFEALTGLLDSYEVTKDETYLKFFTELWDFDKAKFYKAQVGESRQLLTESGEQIIGDMGNHWKGMYHTDRAMMECIMRIRKILTM